MKILFVGNCNHYFNRKLVEELKKFNSQLIIDFFSIEKPNYDLGLKYDTIYDFSIEKKELNIVLKQRGIYSWYCYKHWNRNLKNIIKTNNYNYVHLQSLTVWHQGIESLHQNILLTIWGSDFLRLPDKKRKDFSKLIDSIQKITFATNEISDLFDEKFHTKNKHEIIRFGLNVFKEIDSIHKNDSQDESIYITIGYNRHPAQRHLAILNEIEKLDEDILNKIHLLFPLTYGPLDQNYLNSILDKIKSIGCRYTIYDKFLSEYEMAQICVKSDIMFQLQITDAFSGSMQEYMYANNIVVTGKWLNYNLLKNSGVKFFEIEEFNEISHVLKNVILNLQSEKQNISENKSKLFSISSWEANITKWNNLYK